MPELLVVDDDAVILAALSIRLRAAGLAVRSAANGEEALAMVAQRLPDVAITDIRMPGMDGIELCRRWKTDAATSSFPVVFLSAETCELTREAAMQAGGVRFINKPYQAGELIQSIQQLL